MHTPSFKAYLLADVLPRMTSEEEAAFDRVMYDITGSPTFALDCDGINDAGP